MASNPDGLAPVVVTVRARAGSPIRSAVATLAVALVLIGAVAVTRAPVVIGSALAPVAPTAQGGGAGLTAAARLSSASSVIGSAISPGGAGFSFFALQRTTEYARTAGPMIAVVDPADPRKVIGHTDHLFINAMLSKGEVTPDGFFMAMHLGSQTSSSSADFDAAPAVFSVLSRDGVTWRNDGAGWYQSTDLPGMGIDLATIRLLPRALGRIGSPASAGSESLRGTLAAALTGSVAVADYPGAIAADGAAFTDPAVGVKVWIDGANRPVQLWIRARNTNQPDYDLYSETTVIFDYAPLAALPSPDPTVGPEETFALDFAPTPAPTASPTPIPTPGPTPTPTPSSSN